MQKKGSTSPVLAIFFLALIASVAAFYYIARQPKTEMSPISLPPEETSTTPVATTTPPRTVDIGPFKALAQNSTCADKRNDLYVIDNSLVFLAQEGSCADAGYSFTLFGKTPEEKLCSYHDSIAGPRNTCTDEAYKTFFDTITENTAKDTLGLDATHEVLKIN